MLNNNNDNNFMRTMGPMRMAQAPTVRNAVSSASPLPIGQALWKGVGDARDMLRPKAAVQAIAQDGIEVFERAVGEQARMHMK